MFDTSRRGPGDVDGKPCRRDKSSARERSPRAFLHIERGARVRSVAREDRCAALGERPRLRSLRSIALAIGGAVRDTGPCVENRVVVL